MQPDSPSHESIAFQVFPSSRPTGRAEVQMLAQAIHDIILAQRYNSSDMQIINPLSHSESRKKKEKEERPWDLFHNGELDVDLSLEEVGIAFSSGEVLNGCSLSHQLGVWEMAMVELVRQVQVQCSERGVLLVRNF